MPAAADPSLLDEVRSYGRFDEAACFNCGTCASSCSLAEGRDLFPRKSMRHVQVGLRGPLLASLDPWLCYYCGECSDACPRGAEPGESMMTLRRFLTAQYDWTGLSARLYRSKTWELGALAVVGSLTALLISLFHGPMQFERVELNTFAPPALVHRFDMILLVGLSFFLLTNTWRMVRWTMGGGPGAAAPLPPLISFLREAKTLLLHSLTQPRLRSCGERGRWLKHILLVSGYGLMFGMVVLALDWFQTDELYPFYHPQRWLGYYATVVLVLGAAEILYSRAKGLEPMHRFSDLSDWLFPILLLATALTGIAVHLFRTMDLPLETYCAYALHLIVAVPMLVVEVPFGKWAHLAYRPLAMFLRSVRERAAVTARAA